MSEIIAPSGGIRTSETIGKLAEALAAAQGEFPAIEKTKTADAGTYKYKYADMADVLAAVRPALSKHGLAFTQPTVIEGGTIFIRTRIMHKSGEWQESDYPVAGYAGANHQKIGAALTYARRYAGCAVLGVAAEEDVDAGNDAATAGEHKPQQQRRTTERPKPAVVQSTANGNGSGPKPLPPVVGKQVEPFYLTDYMGERRDDPLSEAQYVRELTAEMESLSKDNLDSCLKQNQAMIDRLSEASKIAVSASIDQCNKAFRAAAVQADPNRGEPGTLV